MIITKIHDYKGSGVFFCFLSFSPLTTGSSKHEFNREEKKIQLEDPETEILYF